MRPSTAPADAGAGDPATPLEADVVLRVLSDAGIRAAGAPEEIGRAPGMASVGVGRFVALLQSGLPCVDVRLPGEFARGHIPGAVSLSAFTDDEHRKMRARLKNGGRASALKLGAELLRPRFDSLAGTVQRLAGVTPPNIGTLSAPRGGEAAPDVTPLRVLVHCCSGGPHGSAVAWMLQQVGGLEPTLLRGGYEAFCSWAGGLYGAADGLAQAEAEGSSEPWALARNPQEPELPASPHLCKTSAPRIAIVGGRTGCGKTRVLHALRDHLGQQVLDLEGMAHHRGAAFGFIGQAPQPTPQQFLNEVAVKWATFDLDRWIFIEDEGPAIGKVSVPPELYDMMRAAPVVLRLLVPKAARVQVLFEDYASEAVRGATPQWQARVESALEKLKKRLGEGLVAEVQELLDGGDYRKFAEVMMLQYYDKLYDAHIMNAGGTGAGGGTRQTTILDIPVDETCQHLDAVDVARQALAALRECEEARVGCSA